MLSPEVAIQLKNLGYDISNPYPKISPYSYNILWYPGTVPGGQNLGSQVVIDSSAAFILVADAFTAWLPSGSGTAVAFTELNRWPGDTLSVTTSGNNGNSMTPLNGLRIQISDNYSQNWMQFPTRVTNVFGRQDQNPQLFQRLIAPGATVAAQLYNDTGAAICAEYNMFGFRYFKNN